MNVERMFCVDGSRFVAGFRGPAILAGAYCLGAEAAFMVGTLSDRIFAPFWPPNVILFSALMIVSYRRWPLYVAAVFPPHVAAELGVGMGWLQILIAFATNCAVAMLSAFVLRALVPKWQGLGNFRSAIIYVLVAAIGSPAICALGGAFVRVAGGGALTDYGAYWEQWFLANALASLTLGAAILAWMDPDEDWREFATPARLGEALVLVIGLFGACILTFSAGAWIDRNFLPALVYILLPLVVWAAARFGTKGASAAVLAVTVASIALTLQGPTVFLRAEAEDNVLALQIFLTALAIPVLLLGSCVQGLRRAEQATAALAGYVLGAQDEERRHIAKRLHEHIGQNIVAATWLAEQIETKLPLPERPIARQLSGALHGSMGDLRRLSYMLHPPLLDEGGLFPALKALAEDYAKRQDVIVDLDIPQNATRFSPDIELTMFRLVQETLANIGRCTSARVSIALPTAARGQSVTLMIEDLSQSGSARGSAQRTAPSDGTFVGTLSVARMRERLRGIGGTLDLPTHAGGLILRASIPIGDQSSA